MTYSLQPAPPRVCVERGCVGTRVGGVPIRAVWVSEQLDVRYRYLVYVPENLSSVERRASAARVAQVSGQRVW